MGSNRPDVTWTGTTHDAYEVHIGSQDVPSSADGWNSGIVWSSADTDMSGPLVPQKTYYVFVRLRNAEGWGDWSTAGHDFYVAGELINEPYYIAGPDGSQYNHSISYNPDRNEYLVAYMDAKAGQRWYISYYRLDGNGTRIGAETTIQDDLEGVHMPAVAYSSVTGEYMIAYNGWDDEWTPDLHDEVRTQRVNATNGAPIGSSNLIHNSPANFELSISYSPDNNVYLLAWHDAAGEAEIYTYRVNGSTGLPVGGLANLTATDSRYSANPSIAYNPDADEFFVIFQIDASGIANWWDYYGRRISASTGTPIGENIPLVTTPVSDHNGDIVYDSTLGRYLLTYESNDGTTSVWGQFLTSVGALEGERFPIASGFWNGGAVGLGQHPNTREYVVAWQHAITSGNYARRLSPTGDLIGEPFRINGDVTVLGNWNPIPVPNTADDEFLICWYNAYNDVYARRYKTYPPVPVTPGDLDADGDVDLFDILRVIDILLGRPPDPTPYEQQAGDIDGDGDIDLFDVLALVDVLLGRS